MPLLAVGTGLLLAGCSLLPQEIQDKLAALGTASPAEQTSPPAQESATAKKAEAAPDQPGADSDSDRPQEDLFLWPTIPKACILGQEIGPEGRPIVDWDPFCDIDGPFGFVTFDKGESFLDDRARKRLYKQAALLLSDTALTATIEGWAELDETGSHAAAQSLARQRAEAVLGHLVGLGLSVDRLSLVTRIAGKQDTGHAAPPPGEAQTPEASESRDAPEEAPGEAAGEAPEEAPEDAAGEAEPEKDTEEEETGIDWLGEGRDTAPAPALAPTRSPPASAQASASKTAPVPGPASAPESGAPSEMLYFGSVPEEQAAGAAAEAAASYRRAVTLLR